MLTVVGGGGCGKGDNKRRREMAALVVLSYKLVYVTCVGE